MAPATRAAKTTSKKPTTKNGDDGAVKRRTRGFHRFCNGILNVTPKGGEKELVNNNQDAPLLRLPPEIRCRIWEYVLGGMTLRSATFRLNDRRFTERMIYTETALLPYKSNIFNFGTYPDFRFDLGSGNDLRIASNVKTSLFEGLTMENLNAVPASKHINVMILQATALGDLRALTDSEHDAEISKATEHTELDVLLAGNNYEPRAR